MSTLLIDQPTAFLNAYGPWALIGGASDGTGEQFCHQIAATGINCVLVARREDLLTTLAQTLETQYGIKTRIVVLDLAVAGAADTLCNAIEDLEIGLFIANAGVGGGGVPFLSGTLEKWNQIMNINIHTPLEICHRLAGPMLERGRGGLLFMCSGVALGGQPRTSVYCASKGFALNLAESLWAELNPKGVSVLSVVAPLIDTPTLRRGFGDRPIPNNLPSMFSAHDVVRTALEELPKGPCYIFPAGPEQNTAAQVTVARRERVEAVMNIAKQIFGE